MKHYNFDEIIRALISDNCDITFTVINIDDDGTISTNEEPHHTTDNSYKQQPAGQ
jgi:hypothetical protein